MLNLDWLEGPWTFWPPIPTPMSLYVDKNIKICAKHLHCIHLAAKDIEAHFTGAGSRHSIGRQHAR